MRIKELLENKDLSDAMARQYEKRADAERAAGGEIKINTAIPTISIKLSDGSEYFYQEWEADELLNSVPGNIDPEDYLLAQAQNW